MPVRIIYWFAALLVLANAENGRRFRETDTPAPWRETSNNLIDIDVYNTVDQDQDGAFMEEISGSGSGDHMAGETDDEDLLNGSSGSGSGAGVVPDFTDTTVFTTPKQTTPVPPTRATPTTAAPRTPCEQLRETSRHLFGNFVPRCTANGEYDSLQCRGHPGTGSCWCADLGGREIPGTALAQSVTPDCERGSNMAPCVYQLVKHSRSGLLGTFRPMCTVTGEFEAKQCKGSMCFCVNKKDGVKITGTEVYLPDDPECDSPGAGTNFNTNINIGRNETEKGLRKDDRQITLHPPSTTGKPKEEVRTIPMDTNIDTEGDKEKDTEKPPTSNETGDSGPMKEPSSAAHVMTQPGILAAIIGGSVVFLLCAVLLIMFIVYRMRKKDEGSYALDEPKKMPNYSYQRAPDREFYA